MRWTRNTNKTRRALTYQEFLATYHVAQSDELESELESCRRENEFGEEAMMVTLALLGWLAWSSKGEDSDLVPAEVRRSQSMPSTKRWLILKMSLFAAAML